MKKRIYLVNWATCHEGVVYNGCVLAPTMKKANSEMRKLYKQSIIQVSEYCEEGKEPYTEFLKDYGYYVSRDTSDDNWERANITVTTINVDKYEDS